MPSAGTRPRLSIVWWSTTGASRQLAEAAAQGAHSEHGVETVITRCDRAGPDDVLASDALIVATPEHLASMAGPMKHFFDRCYYPVLGRTEGRPYALVVAAGSDGSGTIRQLERIFTGWRMRRVAEPLLVITHAQTPEAILAPKTVPRDELERARELGAAMAAGTALGIW